MQFSANKSSYLTNSARLSVIAFLELSFKVEPLSLKALAQKPSLQAGRLAWRTYVVAFGAPTISNAP